MAVAAWGKFVLAKYGNKNEKWIKNSGLKKD